MTLSRMQLNVFSFFQRPLPDYFLFIDFNYMLMIELSEKINAENTHQDQ